MIIIMLTASCKLGLRKCYYKSNSNEFEPLCCCDCCKCEECCPCCPCCQCCECCKKIDYDERYEEEEVFCYIYKVQRKCLWFCDLLLKDNMLSLIIHNICVELGIVGFEKKLNENFESLSLFKDFKYMSFYLIIFLIFSVCYTNSCGFFSRLKSDSGFSPFSLAFFLINNFLSGLSLFGSEKISKRINDIGILFPVAYTKYINFIVMDKLVKIIDKKNIDILTNSFILTSIFFIYDILAFVIIDFIDINSDKLIFFQLALGVILFFILLYSSFIRQIKKSCSKK